ncbi:uncharacterized protein EMH_0050800 [Eimeria mitis]|uniref:Uncharacterized protein n=1 Tax=Eimeria mitis TaxID=44415 RepID=U6K5H4_9EIME|nr:uncharacterized protein EMH_0050800 [Eimeria mitis]CDJ33065.1 hypothetical protein EMH_0050800 [Eimeria mitis]
MVFEKLSTGQSRRPRLAKKGLRKPKALTERGGEDYRVMEVLDQMTRHEEDGPPPVVWEGPAEEAREKGGKKRREERQDLSLGRYGWRGRPNRNNLGVDLLYGGGLK